jgi:2-oxoglutarate ferredoxin oxidoreductase subunit delta
MAAPAETQPNAAPAPAKKVRGTIALVENRCKGCGFCIAYCPPKVLEFSADFNKQGYHFPFLKHPDGCTGCDLCGLYCPDFAIHGVMIKTPRAPAANAGRSEDTPLRGAAP